MDQNEEKLEHKEPNNSSKQQISTWILQDPNYDTFLASTSWLSFS